MKEKIFFSPKKLWLVMMAGICVAVWSVLYNFPHMGVANNGDFYRFAERVGIDGIQYYVGDIYPFYNLLTELWNWKELDWMLLTPFKPSFGNIWPITFIRALTKIFSDTVTTPFNTIYLSYVYTVLFLVACGLLVKFVISKFGALSPYFVIAGGIQFLGSSHLAYFNSFYGEAMLFVGLFLALALLLEAIHTSSWKCSFFTMILHYFASFLFLTAKPQGVLALPFWAIVQIIVTIYLLKNSTVWKRWIRIMLPTILVIHLIWSGLTCWNLYQWNNEYNEKDTLYSAIFNGALLLTETEEEGRQMLEDMGLDPDLIADKGHHPYMPAEQLTLVPRTDEAQEKLYDKINTLGVLKYYLEHPDYLLQVLDITAQHALTPRTNYIQFAGEMHDDNVAENGRFTMWENLRKYVVPHYFWQYVVIYAVLVICALRALFVHRKDMKYTVMVLIYLLIMATGVLQFPLPFIGNGYSDTTKQLYLFMLCWDITMLTTIGYVVWWVRLKLQERQLAH